METNESSVAAGERQKKKLKINYQNVHEEEDRISALPDWLLTYILVCLSNTTLSQAAITTLTLSKRWLRLWTDFYNLRFQNPSTSIFPTKYPGFRSVAKTLIQCRQSDLTKFHLSGDYNIRFESHVNNWIRYAVNCNVEQFNLALKNKDLKAEFVLNQFLFINSCFTHLRLYGCVFNQAGSISWKNLKRLCVSFAKIDERLIENILSGSVLLENLKLEYCYGYMRRLDITSKSVKNLVFAGYWVPESDHFEDDDIIEINAPYILSLTIQHTLVLWKLFLLDVSSLVKVHLNYTKCGDFDTTHVEAEDEMLKRFILNLLHVKELKIGILCNEVLSRLEATGFIFPSNLKVLDSAETADPSDWFDGDSFKSRDWECFYMRGRNENFVSGTGITVKLLRNRIKFEEIMEEEGKDRISTLPDSILIEILCHLPETRYTIRTGTLSKRWKHVWTFIPTLIFQRGYGDDSTSNFFPSIDKTISQCHQLKLYKFELHSRRGYDTQFEPQVNNWIRYAINCNVEELKLDLLGKSSSAEFVLDQCVFINSCITNLTLSRCILNPMGAISWKNLKSLCISHGVLDEDLIENILSGSPLLETLELCCCYGYMYLNITSKSVKNLVFSGYILPFEEWHYYVNVIEVNAPYILSLTIHDEFTLPKLLLLNVSSLVKADFDYWNDFLDNTTQEKMLKELILSLQHVKELKIGISCFKLFFGLEAKGVIFPSNVKLLDSQEDVPDWYDRSDSDDDSDNDSDSDQDGHWKVTRLTN